MAREILDDPVVRKVRDPQDMLDLVLGLPDQVLAGWEAGKEAELPPHPSPPSAVAVLGMGGSGIGGDFFLHTLRPPALWRFSGWGDPGSAGIY